MIDFLQIVIYGIVLGSIIALGAIGVSLIFGILRFAHFAHGDLMTLGAYFALAGVAGMSLPMFAAFGLALGATALVAIGIDRALYSRLQQVSPIILLISSVGVALMLRSLIQMIWGPDNEIYQSGISMPWTFGGLRIQPTQVMIVGGAAGLMLLLHLFLQHTRFGKAMRAMSDNPDLARLSGINTDRIVILTWIIAGVLAAAAGIFLGMDTRLHPIMGWKLLLPVFAAAIFGGIGKPYGAVAGALVIGLAQEMSTLILPAAYKPAVAFALMVIILIWRPTGIFGGKVL
ncbi:branched-chain amino acid ABC transporter permease [Halofilum ochraceum]|uniref:branched-chain amino acid ABC transporter permease n=1 Tax=Halofilum ochraceum TaxID=1611323 RepID=UPI0008DA84C4|nr:branched-chain amino acid ABC transporter permease [Halofilum ochraceum]